MKEAKQSFRTDFLQIRRFALAEQKSKILLNKKKPSKKSESINFDTPRINLEN